MKVVGEQEKEYKIITHLLDPENVISVANLQGMQEPMEAY